jgi:hypothetical protein
VINKNLVLLSYGNASEYIRAIYCILSLSAWLEEDSTNPSIILYTDNPDFFQTYLGDFEIDYSFLSLEQIVELQAGTNFIHRVKVAVIDLTFKRFPDQEVIFIDSDTFFMADPMELFNGLDSSTSFMHKREYSFKDGLKLYNSFKQEEFPQAFIDYITGREFYICGKVEIFDINDYSWNSGVLGLHKGFGSYMPDVMKLTDEFYANSKWFISEQLAFSLILQRRTKISSAEDFVFHYWGKRQKVLMDRLLGRLFEDHVADFTKKVFMRSITRKWKSIIEADLIYEQAENAFIRGNFLYGFKKAFHYFLKKIFIL